jgi:hypothetical protein
MNQVIVSYWITPTSALSSSHLGLKSTQHILDSLRHKMSSLINQSIKLKDIISTSFPFRTKYHKRPLYRGTYHI